MRRVVVGVDDERRSLVVSDEEIKDPGMIWDADPGRAGNWAVPVHPSQAYAPAQPPPGGARWYLSEFEPGRGMAGRNPDSPGMDERGFHVTNSIDLVYILQGTLLLDLDHGTVELRAGDCAVLRAANHAWRNPSSVPARFLDVLVSVEPGSTSERGPRST